MVINVPLLKGFKNFMQLAVGDKFPDFRCKNTEDKFVGVKELGLEGKPFLFGFLYSLDGDVSLGLFGEYSKLMPKIPIDIIFMFNENRSRLNIIERFKDEKSFIALEDFELYYREGVFIQAKEAPEDNPYDIRYMPVIVVDSSHSIVYMEDQRLLSNPKVAKEIIEKAVSVSSPSLKSVKDANSKALV